MNFFFQFLGYVETFLHLIQIAHNNSQSNIKIDGLLSEPLLLTKSRVLQDLLLSMLLHVFATKVLTHFFDNDMELNYQKFKLVNFADDKTIFSGDINSFASLKPILKLYEGASSW